MIFHGHEKSCRAKRRQLALSFIVNVFEQLELVLRDVNLVSWPQLGQFLQASLFLLLHKSFEFFFFVNDRLGPVWLEHFLKIFSGFLNLLVLLVAFFNVAVVLEVLQKLAPRDELLVIDGVLILSHVFHLIGFIFFNFSENLIQSEPLLATAWQLDCIAVNEIDNTLFSAQFHEVLTAL